MNSKLTLVTLLSAASSAMAASSCLAFDASFNLLAFNYGGKDYNAGTQDSWGSGQPTEITASGRPKFDTDGVTCYLAQFFNAVYVMNADKSNPAAVYIYDAGAKSWSTQNVATGGPDMGSAVSILDHDTNVFYTMAQSKMWSLDMASKTAGADTIRWESVGNPTWPNFKPDGYKPVMGLAQNHIHFLNIEGAGKADIFVIHYSYWQPEIQPYSGPEFPAQHGQVASFFKSEGVQKEFAFIPDDASGTYVINVESNSTKALAGPPAKDPSAVYAASITALVSSSSQSGIQFLPYNADGDNSGSKWTKLEKLATLTPASSSSSGGAGGAGNGSPSGSGSGTKPTGTNSGAGNKPTGNSSSSSAADSNNNGAVKAGRSVVLGMFGALVLGSMGVLLI